MEIFNFLKVFSDLPPYIGTMLIANMPIGELRLSIPFALSVYKLTAIEAYFWSILGNLIPVLFILWWLGPVSKYMMKRYGWCKRFFEWLFSRTREKFHHKYRKYGEIALVLLVAIPLPITGAWTGSVAAFLFDIPYRKAIVLISIGLMIAGLIVLTAYKGTLSFFSLF